MQYLERSFKFLFKNYLLVIPALIAAVIPALIGETAITSKMMQILPGLMQNPESLALDPFQLFSSLIPVFTATAIASLLGFILYLVSYPITYGLIDKGLETGRTDLSECTSVLSAHFGKMVLYWLGTIVVGIVLGIAALIVILVFAALIAVLKGFGVFLFVLAIIALILAAIAINVLMALWFPAMIVDNLGLVESLRKSVEIVKTCFWTILGITLLISVGGAIANGIVAAILGWIPFLGTILTSIIPSFIVGLSAAFSLLVYRDKTGKHVSLETAPTETFQM